MEKIYSIMEYILPIELMQYDFIKNAILALLIIGPLFGIIGTMVVNKKMSFFSDALGHSALTGLALGALIGISNYSISMVIFSVIFALGLNYIKSKELASTDTVISAFASTSLALGLIILSKYGGISKYSSILVGDILSISPSEIGALLIVLIVAILIWLIFFNKFLAVSVNPSLAKTKGIKVNLVENIFSVLVAIVVTVSIRWIGLLIINALLILPSASSRNVSKSMSEYTFYSIVFSTFSGIFGLFISYTYNLATGPTIVIISAIIYMITFFLKSKDLK